MWPISLRRSRERICSPIPREFAKGPASVLLMVVGWTGMTCWRFLAVALVRIPSDFSFPFNPPVPCGCICFNTSSMLRPPCFPVYFVSCSRDAKMDVMSLYHFWCVPCQVHCYFSLEHGMSVVSSGSCIMPIDGDRDQVQVFYHANVPYMYGHMSGVRGGPFQRCLGGLRYLCPLSTAHNSKRMPSATSDLTQKLPSRC